MNFTGAYFNHIGPPYHAAGVDIALSDWHIFLSLENGFDYEYCVAQELVWSVCLWFGYHCSYWRLHIWQRGWWSIRRIIFVWDWLWKRLWNTEHMKWRSWNPVHLIWPNADSTMIRRTILVLNWIDMNGTQWFNITVGLTHSFLSRAQLIMNPINWPAFLLWRRMNEPEHSRIYLGSGKIIKLWPRKDYEEYHSSWSINPNILRPYWCCSLWRLLVW